MSDYRLLDETLSMVVRGDAFSRETSEFVDAHFGGDDPNHIARFPLVICDPPYGNIVPESWDKSDYVRWFRHCEEVCEPDATIAMWGGIGKEGNRPFLKFAADFEAKNPTWRIKNWITWSKKRAYGKRDDYLFTREECLILQRGNPAFNIPLLDTKRGYAGYNEKYPAKSEFLRRTNVWTDVTEIFRGKIHPTQKPDRLYEILIVTHSNPEDVVYDPCAGSGTTARAALSTGRHFCIVEREEEYLMRANLWTVRSPAQVEGVV